MHLDDLDVEAGSQRTRRALDQRSEHVDADAHVRAKTIGIVRAMAGERVLLRIVEPGGTDDGGNTVPRARGQVRERTGGRVKSISTSAAREAASTSAPTTTR